MRAVVPEESLDLATDEPEEGLAGTVVMDRYRVIRLLGEGGMGAVYEARHQGIDKRVVIKVLHPELASDPELVERFKREARAATAIGNEHIVDVTDMGELPDGSPCIVMELLDGQDLAELLEGESMLSVSRTVHIIDQVCDALQAAHDKGIVHRDLKPDNVFLISKRRDADFVKVLDFGISKMKEADELNAKLTQTGVAMGTPMYMSPEQAQGLKSLDHRTDIYAVGVMIFEMLAGDPPFTADSYPALLLKMMAEEAPRLTSIRADVPEEISDLVHSMLAKRQDDRPSSMDEVAEAMIAFKAHDGEVQVLRGVHEASPAEMETMPSFPGLAAPIVEPATARHGSVDPADHGLTAPEAPTSLSAPELEPTAEVPRPAAPASSKGLWLIAGVLALLALIGGVFLWQGAQEPAVTPPPEAGHGEEVRAQIRARPAEARIFLDDVEFPNPMDAARARSLTPVRLRIEYEGFRTLERLVVFDQDRALEYELSRAAAPTLPAGEPTPGEETTPAGEPEPTPAGRRTRRSTSSPPGQRPTGESPTAETTPPTGRDTTPASDPPSGGGTDTAADPPEQGSGVLGRRRIRVEF